MCACAPLFRGTRVCFWSQWVKMKVYCLPAKDNGFPESENESGDDDYSADFTLV